MGKFAGPSIKPGQPTDVVLPTEQIQERVPQQEPTPPPQRGTFLDDLVAAPVGDIQEGIQAGVEAELAQQEQIESERIPSIAERAAAPVQEAWVPKIENRPSIPEPDGGYRKRANAMATLFGGPKPQATLSITPKAESRAAVGDPQAVADVEAQIQQGSLTAALNRSGAVNSYQNPDRTWTNEIDPLALQIGSAVTENMFAQSSFGDTQEGITPIDPETPNPTVSKAYNNSKLGQEIHREYQRMKNAQEGRPTDEYTDLPREEATTLGDAFKEMYAQANPDIVQRAEANDQVVFQLTPEGVEAMKAGAIDRKRLFPTVQVRPSKVPTKSGQLPGETGRTAVKKVTGKVKTAVVGADTIQEATRNLNSVPNVVDKQRLRILFSTILPVLAGQLDINHPFAEINNIGRGKMEKFQAAEAAQIRKGDTTYSAIDNMDAIHKKIAQEVRAIAQERNGANYFTYKIQSFNGRIDPQQTYFDATNSKAVRFVTRNAVPSQATPNSRIDKNLRQMYAMMLIKGADALLPEARLKAFDNHRLQLLQWGKRLQEVLDQSMTDAEAEAIAAAIDQGLPLNDPNFPEIRPLGLDPEADADLLRAIEEKGEDGPHFIDGVIDAANYIRAAQAGRPYHSYFNAYIDGKTNGIASNGIQMGDEKVAYATGVVRNQTQRLLDEEGDIRDQLKSDLLNRLETSGFDGDLQEFGPQLYDVAKAVYSHRDLNKATTMTFGYGKELDSFVEDISDAIDLLYERSLNDPESTFSQSVDIISEAEGREVLNETLKNFYVGSLVGVLGADAVQSRAIMRSAAMMHAITNQLFSITSPTGFQLNLGGEATLGFDKETAVTYTINKQGKKQKVVAGQYQTESTAAAIRRDTDEEGNIRATPGQAAYGGSVPAPVQSLDAATVALSASGRTWGKLRSASNGNPYMHTIYDAFKLDAMGFDVGVQEINNNWLEAGMKWSYLESTRESTEEALTAWNKEMLQLPQDTTVDISIDGPYRMMGWLLEPQETQGGTMFPTRLSNRLKNIVHANTLEEADGLSKDATKRVLDKVKRSGVNVYENPKEVTVVQLRVFVKAMADELNLRSRLTAMINKTNEGKKNLRKKIKRDGVLQYYAH